MYTYYKFHDPKSREENFRLARFWLVWIHGGGITGTCGRPVFRRIGETGLSLVRRPTAAYRGAQPDRPK